MGCCGGGHNRHRNMGNHQGHDMNKDGSNSENVKTPNFMPIFALIVVASIVFYFLR